VPASQEAQTLRADAVSPGARGDARWTSCTTRSIAAGRSIRVLSVVDGYTREGLALEVDTSFASRRVTRVLDEILVQRAVRKVMPKRGNTLELPFPEEGEVEVEV
jgi:transposase InsO family protein